ncbi:MAG: septum formation protein Maf [Candidatus Eremiobacteraeota bacterium]|nr:septum formation protein Maf [Candidatus Eremiobacteraeota bacterium]
MEKKLSANKVPSRIILASGSPRRADLLRAMGIKFTVFPVKIDENNFTEEIDRLENIEKIGKIAEKIALKKAESAANKWKEPGLFLTADTMVILDGEILGKPATAKAAGEMLLKLSGKIHHVITGLCVYDSSGGKKSTAHVISRVKFKKLTVAEIEEYVKTGEPLDKAGAYGIQGKGGLLVDEIHGCYYNIVGLPLPRLYVILKDFGIDLLKAGLS